MSFGRIMLDVAGLELTAEDKDLIAHPSVGGIILFKRNFASLAQVLNLVAELRLQKEDLLIAVDQEGGRVQRFKGEFTTLPALGKVGELYDIEQEKGLMAAYNLGWLMAAEIAATSIDFSFAPVLDLGKGISEVIGNRALHADPEIVTILAKAYVDGMHSAGMPAIGKHFPGHGSVVVDSHLGLPEDLRSFIEMEDDIYPFKELIKHGLDAIMPAHVLYLAQDSNPGCFSKYWLQDILREQLGFNGAILSDDLSMQGAAFAGDYLDRASVAFAAGCDMILICNNRKEAELVVERSNINRDLMVSKRLASLRGKKHLTWDELQYSPRWNAAIDMINAWF